jgi:hypothetical protein
MRQPDDLIATLRALAVPAPAPQTPILIGVGAAIGFLMATSVLLGGLVH